MKRKWLMASHGRLQGLIHSICISAVIRCSLPEVTETYWNTPTSSLFFFGLTPHPTYGAWRTGIPQPKVVCGFGHVGFQHWLPQHVNKNQRLTYPTWNCILEDAPGCQIDSHCAVRCQVPFYEDIFTKTFIIHWRFRFCQELKDLWWQTQGFLVDEFWVSKQNVKPKNHCPLGVADPRSHSAAQIASTKALCQWRSPRHWEDTSEVVPTMKRKEIKNDKR